MPSIAVMWFRRDLRVRDLPALADAARAERIVPVFVFDYRLLKSGRFPSAIRTTFMLGCWPSSTRRCATAAPSS
jgi:deoxyribodipyrimidine photo-lyase